MVGVALKRVDLRPTVDPVTGAIAPDRHGGLSPADRAALAVALQLAGRSGATVLAVSVGPPAATAVLQSAMEAGCAAAIRVEAPADLPSDAVAAALAGPLQACRFVLCGDASLDRGSGAVPAFLAGQLGWAQALGVVAVDLPPPDLAPRGAVAARTPEGTVPDDPEAGTLVVERRLERGRRERLAVPAPAVLSVEAGTAALARPPLAAALAARSAPVTVVPGPPVPERAPGRTQPFRPRPRVLDGPDPALPARHRQVALSGALAEHHPPRVVHVDPAAAADELLAYLRASGYAVPEP